MKPNEMSKITKEQIEEPKVPEEILLSPSIEKVKSSVGVPLGSQMIVDGRYMKKGLHGKIFAYDDHSKWVLSSRTKELIEKYEWVAELPIVGPTMSHL